MSAFIDACRLLPPEPLSPQGFDLYRDSRVYQLEESVTLVRILTFHSVSKPNSSQNTETMCIYVYVGSHPRILHEAILCEVYNFKTDGVQSAFP